MKGPVEAVLYDKDLFSLIAKQMKCATQLARMAMVCRLSGDSWWRATCGGGADLWMVLSLPFVLDKSVTRQA